MQRIVRRRKRAEIIKHGPNQEYIALDVLKQEARIIKETILNIVGRIASKGKIIFISRLQLFKMKSLEF